VAFVLAGRTAIVWSDPLCAPDDASTLLGAFLDQARHARLRVALLALDETVARAAMDRGCSVLAIGAEPVFDLGSWHAPRGAAGKKLRWGVNHARRAGVTVDEHRPDGGGDPEVEREIAAVHAEWEARLGNKVVRSFLRAGPLLAADGTRIFLARRAGRLEAFLACSPVEARDGWYLEDLVRLPDATNGATELLVVEALGRLAGDGARTATLGIAPFRGVERQIDRRARWVALAARWALRYFDRRYRFVAMSRYKAKFGPSRWEPRYVAFAPARPRLGTIRAVKAVLDPPRRRTARAAPPAARTAEGPLLRGPTEADPEPRTADADR